MILFCLLQLNVLMFNTMDFNPFLYTATKCANSFTLFFFLPVHIWYETCTFLVTVSVINIQDYYFDLFFLVFSSGCLT